MADEFDPRRAEPHQTFTYVTNEDVVLGDGDEIPDGADVVAIDPETKARTIRRFAVERTLKADADGVVRPKTAADALALDGFALPVARSAIAADKSAAAAPKKEG